MWGVGLLLSEMRQLGAERKDGGTALPLCLADETVHLRSSVLVASLAGVLHGQAGLVAAGEVLLLLFRVFVWVVGFLALLDVSQTTELGFLLWWFLGR